MKEKSSGRVLILGDNDLASLAIVRSLGRAGLTVDLVTFDDVAITRKSRYISQLFDWGHPFSDIEHFTERLLDRLSQQDYDLVIPTADTTLVPLMPWREEINERSRFAAPDEKGFQITHRKDQTIALAQQLGIPTPESQLLTKPEDVSIVRDWSFPLVLKPCYSISPITYRKNEVVRVSSADELGQCLPDLLERSPALIQKFHLGYGVGLSILGRQGELVAAFQHQRVHEPPRGGYSTYRKSVPLSEDLLEYARKFFGEIGWTGPAMMEFKYDPQTNSAILMEINGRFWGSLALAIKAGVDFPKLLYDMLVHNTLQKTFQYRVPYYVRHCPRDLYWLQRNLRTPSGRSDLLKVSHWELFKETFNILRWREAYDLESLSDPKPAVEGWFGFLRGVRQNAGEKWTARQARRQAQRQVRLIRQETAAVSPRFTRARSVLFVCHGS